MRYYEYFFAGVSQAADTLSSGRWKSWFNDWVNESYSASEVLGTNRRELLEEFLDASVTEGKDE